MHETYPFFPIPVAKTVLANGLTVITANTGMLMASARLTFRAGANQDGRFPGLAHFLEHIVYSGAAENGIHPALQHLTRKGVEGNASTSFEWTNYRLWGSSDDLPDIITALLNIAFCSHIDPKEVDRERNVIHRESQQRPSEEETLPLKKRLHPTMTRWHIPVIGTTRSIRTITETELAHFLEANYTPDNAVLVIAGRLDHGAVLEIIERLSDIIPARELQKTHAIDDPGPVLMRTSLQSTQTSDGISLYWDGVTKNQLDDYHRLRVLRGVLLEPFVGTLFKRLRTTERKSYSMSLDVSLFPRAITFRTSVEPADWNPVEQATLEEIDRLKNKDFPTDILDIITSRWRLGLMSQYEGGTSATWVSQLTDRWLYNDFVDWRAFILSINAEDIARVAQRYFPRDRYGCIHTLRKRPND